MSLGRLKSRVPVTAHPGLIFINLLHPIARAGYCKKKVGREDRINGSEATAVTKHGGVRTLNLFNFLL